ncbi:uncharacterized protein LOC121475283 isoform X5 [Vulpes lagopus]|uniref:uncharacterized protein LOC121475283 isoform X5 n=1 Tax=Vulpes lagopus TaxID=494514 RepID=UPI001BCA030A|nr:uncharacterized protein LOC121475283 isoform X5 [Vulpes lagopus]
MKEVLQNGSSLWFKAKSPSCSSHPDRDQHLCLSPEASQGPTGAEVRRPADLGHQAERVAASHHQAHHESCSKHSGRSCSSNRAYPWVCEPRGAAAQLDIPRGIGMQKARFWAAPAGSTPNPAAPSSSQFPVLDLLSNLMVQKKKKGKEEREEGVEEGVRKDYNQRKRPSCWPPFDI